MGPKSRLILSIIAWSSVIAAAPKTRDFFDDTVIQQISLKLAPEDWATLKKNYQLNDYYPATLSWNGITLSIGIRSRGSGSRSPIKPNLDCKIDKYTKKQRFLDISYFTLKANNQDPSAMHETLSMKLYQRMGIASPREAPARVTVNDELMGFYTIVEHIDEDFLDRVFGDSSGYLYEWSWKEEYNWEDLGSDPAAYSPSHFEPKNHDSDPDPQPLADMIGFINHSTDDEFARGIGAYIDPYVFLNTCATERTLTDIDGIVGGVYGIGNFYIYRFTGTKLHQIIPWDKDLTFTDPAVTLFDGFDRNVLLNRLLKVPVFRTAYLRAAMQAAQRFGGPGGWADQELSRQYNLVRDLATRDPYKQCIQDSGAIASCGAAEFESEVLRMRDFIAARLPFLRTYVSSLGFVETAQLPFATDTGGIGEERPSIGSFARLSGMNLGTEAVATGDYLPRVLAGTWLTVNGARVPLYSTSSGEICFQVPWESATGEASVVPVVQGRAGDVVMMYVRAISPGILTVSHLDGSLVDDSQPATPGEEIVLYAVGLGDLVLEPPSGVAAPAGALIETENAVFARVDTLPAAVSFCGLAPGLVGVYQIKMTIPIDMTPSKSTRVTIMEQDTETSITIAVRD